MKDKFIYFGEELVEYVPSMARIIWTRTLPKAICRNGIQGDGGTSQTDHINHFEFYGEWKKEDGKNIFV